MFTIFVLFHQVFLSIFPLSLIPNCFFLNSVFTFSHFCLLCFPTVRRWTLWRLIWMWRSAVCHCCPETEKRTGAWTCCLLTEPWHSLSPQRWMAATISTQHWWTVSFGQPPSWWRLTHYPSLLQISGGWCLIMAAPPSSCSTRSTNPTLPGCVAPQFLLIS